MEFRIGNEGTPRRASPSFYDGSHRLLSTSGRPFFRSFFTVLSNPLKPLQELDHTPTVLPGAILVRHPSRFPFPLSPLSSSRFGGPSRPPPRRMPIGRPYATGALHQALFLRATPPFSDSEHAPATRQRTGSDGEQTTQMPSTKHRFPAAIGLAAVVEKSARPTSRPRSRHERGWNKFSETSENRRVFQGFMLTPKGVPVARSTFRTASPKRLESEPNTTESLGISVLPQRSHPSREIVFFLISAPGSKLVGGCATGRLAMHFLRHLPSPESARTLLGAPSSGAPSKPTDAVLSPFFVPCRECFFSSTRFDRYPFRKR